MTIKNVLIGERKHNVYLNPTLNFIFNGSFDREDTLIHIKTPSQRNITTKLQQGAIIFVMHNEDLVCILRPLSANDKKYEVRMSYHNPDKSYYNIMFKYSEFNECLKNTHKDKELEYYYVEQNKDVIEKKTKRNSIDKIDRLKPINKLGNNYQTLYRYEKLSSIYVLKLNTKAQYHINIINNHIDIKSALTAAVQAGNCGGLNIDKLIKDDEFLNSHYLEIQHITTLIESLNKYMFTLSPFFLMELEKVKQYLNK